MSSSTNEQNEKSLLNLNDILDEMDQYRDQADLEKMIQEEADDRYFDHRIDIIEQQLYQKNDLDQVLDHLNLVGRQGENPTLINRTILETLAQAYLCCRGGPPVVFPGHKIAKITWMVRRRCTKLQHDWCEFGVIWSFELSNATSSNLSSSFYSDSLLSSAVSARRGSHMDYTCDALTIIHYGRDAFRNYVFFEQPRTTWNWWRELVPGFEDIIYDSDEDGDNENEQQQQQQQQKTEAKLD